MGQEVCCPKIESLNPVTAVPSAGRADRVLFKSGLDAPRGRRPLFDRTWTDIEIKRAKLHNYMPKILSVLQGQQVPEHCSGDRFG